MLPRGRVPLVVRELRASCGSRRATGSVRGARTDQPARRRSNQGGPGRCPPVDRDDRQPRRRPRARVGILHRPHPGGRNRGLRRRGRARRRHAGCPEAHGATRRRFGRGRDRRDQAGRWRGMSGAPSRRPASRSPSHGASDYPSTSWACPSASGTRYSAPPPNVSGVGHQTADCPPAQTRAGGSRTSSRPRGRRLPTRARRPRSTMRSGVPSVASPPTMMSGRHSCTGTCTSGMRFEQHKASSWSIQMAPVRGGIRPGHRDARGPGGAHER
jgi:hypothetical protein